MQVMRYILYIYIYVLAVYRWIYTHGKLLLYAEVNVLLVVDRCILRTNACKYCIKRFPIIKRFDRIKSFQIRNVILEILQLSVLWYLIIKCALQYNFNHHLRSHTKFSCHESVNSLLHLRYLSNVLCHCSCDFYKCVIPSDDLTSLARQFLKPRWSDRYEERYRK